METEALLTPYEVARLFKVDTKTVTHWADAGKLGRVLRTPGGSRRFFEADIMRIRAERTSHDLPE